MPLPPKRPGQQAPPEDPATARRQQEELADECGRLEEELEALKAKYEAYFLGIERREPNRWRDELKKRVNIIKGAFTRNTGLRFRMQALHARYLSYERLWMRTAREKEEGTYRRDIYKAKLRGGTSEAAAKQEAAAAAPGPAAAAASTQGGAVASAKVTPAAGAAVPSAQAARPGTPVTPPPRAGAATPPPAADPRMRALFDEYVAAKRRCNEDVSRLTYDAVARSVAKQVPELMSRYKAKSVDFRVEVKDGKAILKAIPKL